MHDAELAEPCQHLGGFYSAVHIAEDPIYDISHDSPIPVAGTLLAMALDPLNCRWRWLNPIVVVTVLVAAICNSHCRQRPLGPILAATAATTHDGWSLSKPAITHRFGKLTIHAQLVLAIQSECCRCHSSNTLWTQLVRAKNAKNYSYKADDLFKTIFSS